MSNRYVGLWHGGASYSYPEWDDAELFGSIAEATEALRDRYQSGRHQRFHYITRGVEHTDTPAVGEGSMLVLYRWTMDDSLAMLRQAIETDGPAVADVILEIGPRGGVQRTI